MTVVGRRPEAEETLLCELKNTVASVRSIDATIAGKDADDLLRGEWFGLASMLDLETERLLVNCQKELVKGGGRSKSKLEQLRGRRCERLGQRFDSPLDELAVEIANEARSSILAATTPDERRARIQQAAAKLRMRLNHAKA